MMNRLGGSCNNYTVAALIYMDRLHITAAG